jgi:putative endonuclease
MTSARSRLGALGEDLAETFLRMRGASILERNYRWCRIEIDIIAEDRGVLAFTEVKLKTSDEFGCPSQMVTATKRRRIVMAAQQFAFERNLGDWPIRFDVISIRFDRTGGELYLEHIMNAFSARR